MPFYVCSQKDYRSLGSCQILTFKPQTVIRMYFLLSQKLALMLLKNFRLAILVPGKCDYILMFNAP